MSRENCFQGLSYLQHPFLQHPKQKTVDKKIAILRFRNPFEELLDHLKMPQTEPFLHVLMLSLLIMTYNLQYLPPLFFLLKNIEVQKLLI